MNFPERNGLFDSLKYFPRFVVLLRLSSDFNFIILDLPVRNRYILYYISDATCPASVILKNNEKNKVCNLFHINDIMFNHQTSLTQRLNCEIRT